MRLLVTTLLLVLLIDWMIRINRSATEAWDRELDEALREKFGGDK